jgi:hypothetical protein
MSSLSTDDFNFDTFARLAKDDPVEFDRLRQQLIDANIAAAPRHLQSRLRQLQCRADLVREGATSPMAATLKLSSMMWETVVGPGGLREALNALVSVGERQQRPNPVDGKKAAVLPFPTK